MIVYNGKRWCVGILDTISAVVAIDIWLKKPLIAPLSKVRRGGGGRREQVVNDRLKQERNVTFRSSLRSDCPS